MSPTIYLNIKSNYADDKHSKQESEVNTSLICKSNAIVPQDIITMSASSKFR